MKEGQRERRVACDYDAAEVIEKIHCELEHARNNKVPRLTIPRATVIRRILTERVQVVMWMTVASKVQEQKGYE